MPLEYWLRKQSDVTRQFKSRYLVLHGGVLYSYREMDASKRCATYPLPPSDSSMQWDLRAHGHRVRVLSKSQRTFSVDGNFSSALVLQAESDTVLQVWVSALSACIRGTDWPQTDLEYRELRFLVSDWIGESSSGSMYLTLDVDGCLLYLHVVRGSSLNYIQLRLAFHDPASSIGVSMYRAVNSSTDSAEGSNKQKTIFKGSIQRSECQALLVGMTHSSYVILSNDMDSRITPQGSREGSIDLPLSPSAAPARKGIGESQNSRDMVLLFQVSPVESYLTTLVASTLEEEVNDYDVSRETVTSDLNPATLKADITRFIGTMSSVGSMFTILMNVVTWKHKLWTVLWASYIHIVLWHIDHIVQIVSAHLGFLLLLRALMWHLQKHRLMTCQIRAHSSNTSEKSATSTYVWENQRRLFGSSKFSEESLFVFDRSGWTNSSNEDVQRCDSDETWKVLHDHGTDGNGWMYAVKWSGPWKPQPGPFTFVRRRAWGSSNSSTQAITTENPSRQVSVEKPVSGLGSRHLSGFVTSKLRAARANIEKIVADHQLLFAGDNDDCCLPIESKTKVEPSAGHHEDSVVGGVVGVIRGAATGIQSVRLTLESISRAVSKISRIWSGESGPATVFVGAALLIICFAATIADTRILLQGCLVGLLAFGYHERQWLNDVYDTFSFVRTAPVILTSRSYKLDQVTRRAAYLGASDVLTAGVQGSTAASVSTALSTLTQGPVSHRDLGECSCVRTLSMRVLDGGPKRIECVPWVASSALDKLLYSVSE